MMSEYNMTCMIFLNGYFWNKGFKHNCYFMFEDALFMVSTSFMMYEMNMYWIDYILPYNHELLCTRVDTAHVITSGKTLFSMSALCKDTHKIDQNRYSYVLEANSVEATLLVAYFTKKVVVKIKEQMSHTSIHMLVLLETMKKNKPYQDVAKTSINGVDSIKRGTSLII